MVRHGWFFFALFSLFRFSISLGLIERPLIIGLFWGLFFGNMETSLFTAIFYELLWLDFIPVGTFIPPHMTAAAFTSLALNAQFGFDSLPLCVLSLIAGLPMAWFGARLERTMRDRLNRSYGKMLLWARKPVDLDLPGKLLTGTLVSKILANWIFFLVGTVALSLAIRFCLTFYGGELAGIKVNWSQLLIAASVGGLLALRLRSLYVSIGIGAAAFGFLRFFGMF